MAQTVAAREKGLSGNALKIIAVLSMVIDHIGASIIEQGIFHRPDAEAVQAVLSTDIGLKWFFADRVLRTVGRLAFPIMAFLLVEGYLHTRDFKKYAERMFLFALISEIPFDLAFYGTWFAPRHQNVFFTLFIGLLVLEGYSRFQFSQTKQQLIMLAGCAIALLLRCDYDATGIILILVMYIFHENKKYMTLMGALIAGIGSSSNFFAAALAFIPIYMYNGTRGRMKLKYFFYLFYPVHLLVLYAARVLIFS